MCANLTIHLTEQHRRITSNIRKTSDVEMLRRKLLRDTESYLNNPRAASWGRLNCQAGDFPKKILHEVSI